MGQSSSVDQRSTSEIFREDGIWEQSHMWFPAIDGKPVKTQGEWRFPVGSSIAFRPMREGGKDLARYCGSQLAFIGFDNITRFTNSMFIFLLSRNRTTCGVKPHVRATLSLETLEPDSWVSRLLDWWIDDTTSDAIEDRNGKIRHLVIRGKEWLWADSEREATEKYGKKSLSVQFINGSIQ